MPRGPSTRTFPALNLKTITANGVDFEVPPRSLRVKVAGNLSWTNQDGTTESAVPVTAGEVLSFQPRNILASGTTATVQGYFD